MKNLFILIGDSSSGLDILTTDLAEKFKLKIIDHLKIYKFMRLNVQSENLKNVRFSTNDLNGFINEIFKEEYNENGYILLNFPKEDSVKVIFKFFF